MSAVVALRKAAREARRNSFNGAVRLDDTLADLLEAMIPLAEDEAGCPDCPICVAVHAAVAVASEYTDGED